MNSYKNYKFINLNNKSAKFQINCEKIYQLCISTNPYCTCKNFTIKYLCSHIYYILIYFFKIKPTSKILRKNYLTNQEVKNIFIKKNLIYKQKKNKLCCICLEKTCSKNIKTCYFCCNDFHKNCLTQWFTQRIISNLITTCPLCRNIFY